MYLFPFLWLHFQVMKNWFSYCKINIALLSLQWWLLRKTNIFTLSGGACAGGWVVALVWILLFAFPFWALRDLWVQKKNLWKAIIFPSKYKTLQLQPFKHLSVYFLCEVMFTWDGWWGFLLGTGPGYFSWRCRAAPEWGRPEEEPPTGRRSTGRPWGSSLR